MKNEQRGDSERETDIAMKHTSIVRLTKAGGNKPLCWTVIQLVLLKATCFQNVLKYKTYTIYLESKLYESILQQLGILKMYLK
jgi:hypothetical protein